MRLKQCRSEKRIAIEVAGDLGSIQDLHTAMAIFELRSSVREICVDRWRFRVIDLLDGNKFYDSCGRGFRSFRGHGFLLSALKVVRGPKWGINDCVA